MSESLHLACPACMAVNRVPAQRLGQGPKCGKCRERLFSARPVSLTQDTFGRFLRGNDVPVVVDFWAPWCGPCKAMAPAFEQAAGELEPDVRLAKLDTEAQPTPAAQFNIRSIPTMVIFLKGNEIARHSGAIGAADIVRWVRGALG